ncbi:MAG: tetratricopeptide repeat protein [Planctomycetota bacterium]|jgi:hypothetical protein
MGKGKRGVITTRSLCKAMRYALVIALLVVSTECKTLKLKDHWARYYDPDDGKEIEDIQNNFNLHRGRYWNYYDRGSVYLAYGHYDKAREDFKKAADKRSRDKWDARTYGMHFIDYFPHRELGVAYYLQSEQKTEVARKEEQLRKAICELETSLSQEESSRAKFFLNEARRSLWQVTKEKDKIPPKIHVNKPIYTNQRTVLFNVTVTDQDSHVKDIQIGSSCGDVKIDKPRLFVELAKKEITERVELKVGPKDKYAVVTITATDLAGNESEPDNTLIIVDKQAPTAGLDIIRENIRSDGQVEISIDAMDDFGLSHIQIWDDPNDKIDCDSAMEYSCNITGTPRAGNLAITIVDNAGNTTTASIRVEDENTTSQLERIARPQISRRSLLTKAGNWNPPLSQAYLRTLDFPKPHNSVPIYRATYGQTSSFTVAPQHIANKETVWGAELEFEKYVRPEGNKAKETSQDFFIVEGTLKNPLNISLIKIKMDAQEITVDKIHSTRDMSIFKGEVNLTDVPIGKTKTIRVEAYRKQNLDTPYFTEELKVKKVNDVSREGDAIYGMLLLPLSLSYGSGITAASSLSDWNTSRLSGIYEDILKKFKSLTMPDRSSPESLIRENEESLEAFRIYHINDVYKIPNTEAWYKLNKTEEDVVRDLSDWINRGSRNVSNFKDPNGIDPSLIDLIVYGEVIVNNTEASGRIIHQGFSIKLEAIDVLSRTWLKFPKGELVEKVNVLADKYLKTQDLIDRTQDMNYDIEDLASIVAYRIPRLHANIKVDNSGIRSTKPVIQCKLGRKQGVFSRMRCCVYEQDAHINAKLTKIECLDIVDFDSSSTWIKCDKKQSLPPKNVPLCTLITK